MTGRKFFNSVAKGEADILDVFLSLLKETKARYCVVGGLAVNAYAEPVVSLDLDMVIASKGLAKVRESSIAKGFKVQEFERSVNLSHPGSDLRIQLQTDARYQSFIPRARVRMVLGYKMAVASLEDVLQGKIWAYFDLTRRKSKRQKDLADILRLVENYPRLKSRLPRAMRFEGG
jgi:hypothetical protein